MRIFMHVEGRKNSDNFLTSLRRGVSWPGSPFHSPSIYSVSYLSFNIKYLTILAFTAVLANLTTFVSTYPKIAKDYASHASVSRNAFTPDNASISRTKKLRNGSLG